MYYGNPECYDQESPEDVWDSDYVGVWHLNATRGLSIDATSTSYDARPSGEISQISEGRIGYGDEFYGQSNNQLSISDNSALEPSSLTLEMWWNTEWLPTAATDYSATFSNANNAWTAGYSMSLFKSDANGLNGFIFYSNVNDFVEVEWPTSNIDKYQWYWAAATYDGGTDGSELFINGSSVDTASTTGAITDPSVDIKIGNHDFDEWTGKLDEIRLSKVVRSDAWLSTSFNTQNNSGFYSIGSEESTGAAPGYEWVELYNRGDTAVDLTGWYITDKDGNKFYFTGAGSIVADSYVVGHLSQVGTNSSTDVYGRVSATTVDSIIIQPGSSNGKDSFLYQGSPTDRNGEDNYFECADYNDGGEERLLFEFNMTYIPGTTITDANLWLYRYSGSGTANGHLNVRRITRNWTEAYVDWNNYDSGNAWSSGGGGDFTDKVYSWKTINPNVNKWYYWNVTELINGWKNGSWENYGLEIEAHWATGWQQFRSSDYYTDLSLRPYLVVNYSYSSPLILNMLDNEDYVALCNSNDEAIDYVVWGADPGTQGSASALARGLWQNGVYVDTSGMLENETLGRDKDSEDNDTAGDWENSTSNKADPYGIDTPVVTPGAQNVFIIPEFSEVAAAVVICFTITIFTLIKNRKKKDQPSNKPGQKIQNKPRRGRR
jgi:hypothetical protein